MTAPATVTRARSASMAGARWPVVAVGAVALAGLTLWLRYRSLGISSLWLDDAWVGVGAHLPTIGDTIGSGLTSPGFSVIYRAWATVFGTDATTAQLLALAFAVVAPVVLFLAAIERGLPAYAALLGGGLLATAPAHIEMSTRLKQYSAEALAATLVLWMAWRVLDRPGSSSRWAAFAVIAIVVSLVSSIGALTAAGALAVGIVAAALARPRRLLPAITASGAYAVVVLPWLVFIVRPNLHEKLTDYWRGYFLDGSGFAGGIRPRLEALADGFQGIDSTLVLLGLVVAAVIVLARRPLVGVLLVTPTLVAIPLAALTILPIGTGRTDVYLFPSYALLVAVAVAEIAGMVPAHRRWVAGAVAAAAFVVVVLAALPPAKDAYIQEDLTPLVHLAERNRKLGDEIVVYPTAGYAYGIATRYPIEKRADRLAPTDWVVDVRGPDITVLRAHRTDPEKWADPLDRLTAASPRLWVIGSHLFPDWLVLQDMLKERGYRAARVHTRIGAQLVLFVKDEPPPDPVA